MPARGFTLVELIVVMAVVGVLAAVVGPRMTENAPFSARAAGDAVASALRSAQRTAVAQRATVYVQVVAAAGTVALCADAGCVNPITAPDGAATWAQAASGLRFNADASFSVNAFGQPSFAAVYTVHVLYADGSDSGRGAQMQPETGYVTAL